MIIKTIMLALLAINVITRYHIQKAERMPTLSLNLDNMPFKHGDLIFTCKRKLTFTDHFYHAAAVSFSGTPFFHAGMVIGDGPNQNILHFVSSSYQPRYKSLYGNPHLQMGPLADFLSKQHKKHMPLILCLRNDRFGSSVDQVLQAAQGFKDLTYAHRCDAILLQNHTRDDTLREKQAHCMIFIGLLLEMLHMLPQDDSPQTNYIPGKMFKILTRNNYKQVGVYEIKMKSSPST